MHPKRPLRKNDGFLIVLLGLAVNRVAPVW